jgi:hypothetical protein
MKVFRPSYITENAPRHKKLIASLKDPDRWGGHSGGHQDYFCLTMVERYELQLTSSERGINLFEKDGSSMGLVVTLKELATFFTGYEAAMRRMGVKWPEISGHWVDDGTGETEVQEP